MAEGFGFITTNDYYGMGSLPFCFQTIQVVRCHIGPHFTEKKGYPVGPKTIGEMIRKRRLDLGLRQTETAKMIGCDEMSIVNWEKGYSTPSINHLASVVKFLGFNPFPNGDTMAHRLVNHRKALGITQKEFAHQLGVDPSTWARWERGERKPTGKYLDRVVALCPCIPAHS